MSEHVRNSEEFSLGMAFMAFLMSIAALCGMWFLPVLIKTLTKIVG